MVKGMHICSETPVPLSLSRSVSVFVSNYEQNLLTCTAALLELHLYKWIHDKKEQDED